jgi:hypothetical protein
LFLTVTFTFTSFIIGLLVGRFSSHQQQYFGNILIGTSVFGSFMYGGYTWYDEAFLSGIIIYILCRVNIYNKSKFFNVKRADYVYALFLLYFLFASINGIFYFLSVGTELPYIVQKFRWIGFVLLLVATLLLGDLEKRSNLKVTSGQLVASIIFLLFYLISNYVVFRRTGSPAYAQYAQVPNRGLIDAIWASTAYVSTSVTILLAVGILGFLSSKSKSKILLSYVVLALGSFINGFTLSRSGFLLSLLLVIAAFVPSFYRKKALHNILASVIIICFTILGTQLAGVGLPKAFFCDVQRMFVSSCYELNDAEVTFQQSLNPDRKAQYDDAQRSYAESNNLRKYFGYGLRTSGLYLQKVMNTPTEHAMAFAPSILIEFGIIGIILLGSTILFSIKIIFQQTKSPPVLTLALILGAWSTIIVINNFDFIALYLLIGSRQILRWLSVSETVRD